jgi:coenzyme F420 hydrogenase subunit beta
MKSNPADLLNTVLDAGLCVGCGVCAAMENEPFEMALNPFGQYEARLTAADPSPAVAALAVCPFADEGPHEDEIAARFDQTCTPDAEIGYHLATYAGWSLAGERRTGSSGGLTSWLLAELIRQSVVDAVIHVTPGGSPSGGGTAPLFSYSVSDSVEGVAAGAKTRYYPVELSAALRTVRERPARYAIVGVPCVIKAIHRLRHIDPVIADSIHTTVSLVCGHQKSSRFADSLAWQLGIPPGQLDTIDFRHKLEGRPASQYGVSVRSVPVDGRLDTRIHPMDGLDGQDWGHGLFKYRACDFCDDVLGETADITFGDAWLPQFEDDWRGANVVVVRRPDLLEILNSARDKSEVALVELSPADVANSQRAGLRHRRDGLAYRLALADRNGEWRPRKRVPAATDHLTERQKEIFRLRAAIANRSHTAFAQAVEAGRYGVFARRVRPLIWRYQRLYGRPRARIAARWVRSAMLRRFRNKR